MSESQNSPVAGQESAPLSHLSVLRLSGPDAGRFLQAQLSADVKNLQPDQTRLACYCDPRGRVLAVIWLHRLGADTYLAILHQSLLDTIEQRLKLYLLRDQVAIGREPNQLYGIGMDNGVNAGGGVLVLHPLDPQRAIHVGTPGVAGCISEARWRRADIQAAMPWLDSGSSGQYLPQMLNLDQTEAVDFGKGCYPGQEVIARSHYLGKVKRRLHQVSLSSNQIPARLPQDIIGGGAHEGKKLGQLIAYAAPATATAEPAVGLAVLKQPLPECTLRLAEQPDIELQIC